MSAGDTKSSVTASFLAGQGIYPSPAAKVFYLNNATSGLADGALGGSNGNDGLDPLRPFSTLAYALTKCTAGRGDVIVVLPGHAETVTAVISVATAGVQIIGCKIGNKRPTFTINGAVDLFSLDAANCSLQSIQCAIVTTDAATAFVNVTAANCAIKDLHMIPSSGTENVVDVITLASGANDVLIEGIYIFNTTVAVNSFLSIEAAVARPRVKDFYAFGDTATGGIIDGAAATQILFENINIGTVGTTQPASTLDSNPTGMILRSFFAGTSTTLANNGANGTGVRQSEVRLLEETDNSKQGVQIPAVDVD